MSDRKHLVVVYDEDRAIAEARTAELRRQCRRAVRSGGRHADFAAGVQAFQASSPRELFRLLRTDGYPHPEATALVDLRKDRDRGRLPGLLVIDILSWNANGQFRRVLPVAWTAASSATLPNDVADHGGCGVIEVGWSQAEPQNLVQAMSVIHAQTWPRRTSVLPPHHPETSGALWFADRKPATPDEDRATRARVIEEHTHVVVDPDVVDVALEHGRGLSKSGIKRHWPWSFAQAARFFRELEHRPDAVWEGAYAAQQLAAVHDDPRLPPLPPPHVGLIPTAVSAAEWWPEIRDRYPVFTRPEELALGRYFHMLDAWRRRGYRGGLTEAKHADACRFAHNKLVEDPGIAQLLPNEETTVTLIDRAILKVAFLASEPEVGSAAA